MYVIDTPAQPSLPVADSTDHFPVRRIFCVGRNYEDHVVEMGNDTREPPFFFNKPADAALGAPCRVPYPPLTENLHFEIELIVAIGKGGRNIPEEEVMDHVWGASVGIDLTRRDLQAEAKKMGRPWDWAKAFDHSAPIAPIRPLAKVPSLEEGRIWLAVNGEMKQESDISMMIWPVREHLAILSQAMELAPGDIVMTGTPAGVGAVVPGDVITGGVDGIGELRVEIGPRA
jgi:fumarylpyruvate hydrolase